MKQSTYLRPGLLLAIFTALASSPWTMPVWAQCGEPGPSPPFTAKIHDLEEDAAAWGAFCEGSPTYVIRNVRSPALAGRSLECSITGGTERYSNVHCFVNLAAAPDAMNFILELSFYYTPATTHAAEDAIVQALELTMNKWQDGKRHEWALQWRNVGAGGAENVGEGAPQWYYWDGSRSGDDRWVRIQNLPFDHRLEANRWHTLVIEGHIENDDVHYRRFQVGNEDYIVSHEIDVTAPAVAISPTDVNRLSVAIQLDGNFEPAPYQTFIDEVSLIRTRCVPSDTSLCLREGRFRVTANWQTAAAGGSGQAVKLTADTGYFWFFNRENVELILKVLNGCLINGHFWVFASGLTDVGVMITVEDTATGDIRTYSNPQGTPFEVILGTNAFPTCP